MVVSADEIGRRIAEARGRANMTQAQLADAVSLPRTALSKIETGAQRISAADLALVADTLGARIEWFVEPAPAAIISRRNAQEPGAPSPRIDALVERVARGVEFVVKHSDRFVLAHTEPYALPANSSEIEQLAGTARRRLAVSLEGPLPHLDRRASAMGLAVFAIDLGVETADAATILLESGGVSVINAARHVGRRRLALAHEIGHYLVADEYTVDWRVAEHQDSDVRENLFDRFARALLLPADSIRHEWIEQSTSRERDTRTAAVYLASRYRVDMTTLARRLVDLDLISRGTGREIRSFKTNRADIVEMDLVVGEEMRPPTLPVEFERAVLQLYRSETISSARALDLLLDAWNEEDLPELPGRTENEIWQFV